MISSRPQTAVRIWLAACCAMVAAMVVLGAITRLTQSGLSITRWDPVMGAVPPLDQAGWQAAFAAYQQTPQYRLLNSGMSIDAFRHIYFWEWLHRLWGRLIGLVFALPLLVFWWRGLVARGLGLRLAGIFALGGLQGLAGWLMVQSGLVERTAVSPWRLAVHLDLALLIYALLVWTLLSLGAGPPRPCSPTYRRLGWGLLGLVVVTITLGALVAGTFGGTIYGTWPMMEGNWLPDAALALDPAWLNVIENPVMAQFLHRWAGPITMVAVLAWAWRGRDHLLAGWVVAQVGLGLATLLSGAALPLAVAHQAGAVVLLTLLLRALFARRSSPMITSSATASPYQVSA
jgi:cytochrome c oxidase assembly protein subunit 15